MNFLPKRNRQFVHEFETTSQSLQAVQPHPSLGQPRHQLQVFGFLGQGLKALLFDIQPIGLFEWTLPLAHGQMGVVFLTGQSDVRIDGLIPQRRPTRRLLTHGQQDFPQFE